MKNEIVFIQMLSTIAGGTWAYLNQYLHAVDAWATSWCHSIADFVCDALYLAAASRDFATTSLEMR